MAATAPTEAGYATLDLVNTMLEAIGEPPIVLAELSYTGTGIQAQAERFAYRYARDYFGKWVEGGIAKHVGYAVTGTTLNVLTTAATSPSLTFNMAMNVRGSGDYQGRQFSMRGDGVVMENGKAKTFGTETVTLDIATGPVFNTGAADDATAWRAWYAAINSDLKGALTHEIAQKWRVYKKPDPTMDAFMERDRVRAEIPVARAAEGRLEQVQTPPQVQAMGVGGQRNQ